MNGKKFLIALAVVCVLAYALGASTEAMAEGETSNAQRVANIRAAVLPYGVDNEWEVKLLIYDHPAGLYSMMNLCHNYGGYWYWSVDNWKWNYCSWTEE